MSSYNTDTNISESDELNPIDCVEDVLNDHNWVYSRMTDEKLLVEVSGKNSNYKVLFSWQENVNALQISCEYDLSILPENTDITAQALMTINAAVWMGHFEVMHDTLTPRFRQTTLLRGRAGRSEYEYIEDLIDISLNQCEHYQPVFDILSTDNAVNADTISFAMMETAGES